MDVFFYIVGTAALVAFLAFLLAVWATLKVFSERLDDEVEDDIRKYADDSKVAAAREVH